MLWLAQITGPLENGIRQALFAAQPRDASLQLVVVEMDAASLASIGSWPWPRSHYGKLVDRLDAAGARSISFDVDVSARSSVDEDARFAHSIDHARSVIVLPTFAQRATHASFRILDSLPIAELRRSAMLASVSVKPDGDGMVRAMPIGTVTDNTPRPSLSAQIAQRGGSVGGEYPLDLSIDPNSIPRLSFLAVEEGNFDPRQIAGKDVLVGATAIEMGDRYAVPSHGILPGVVVQALGAETLYRGSPFEGGGAALLACAFFFSFGITLAASKRGVAARGAFSIVGIVLVWQSAWSWGHLLFQITPALVAVVLATALRATSLLQDEFRHRRTHDADTGLPNRNAMLHGSSEAQFTVAATIGGFETLHTVLGDGLSSELVRRLAERLASGVHGLTVYRIEDRTLAWLSEQADFDLEQAIEGLVAIMRQPVEIGGRRVDVQLAFGIAEAGAITEATHAASEALRMGTHWAYHQAAQKSVLERQVSLMGELDTALHRDEIEVLYQPKLHLASDRITSVEALVRWNHPTRGYLRPDLFIPLAEESDRITDLTLFVLKRTIEDLGTWCAKGLVISAAVNISARLIESPMFLSAAEALLAGTGVPRHRVTFEVTESAALADVESAASALQKFRDMGIEISMDDYGTGQSTLSYLKRLPLSELKIDRSFVQFAHQDKSDALLVSSTLELAHALGLKVVAEGVEDQACLDFLRRIGCDYAQGYLIAKPMASSDLADLVAPRLSQVA